MTVTQNRFVIRALAAALSLVAACSVSEGGKIPCADDSSCPTDYPVCTAGKCAAGTPASTSAASIAIVGVDGKLATEPVRQTVHLNVTARAESGVTSVTLAGGTKTYSPTGTPTPPLYGFDVDTTQIADGDVDFTAKITPGDPTVSPVTSGKFTVHIDNTPPTLTSSTTIPDASLGTLVTLDVTASEALSALVANVLFGGNVVGQAIETSAATGNVHHLGFAVVTGLPTGTYTFSITATDLAGNATAAALTSSFGIRVAVPLTDMVVANSLGVTEAGLPAATTASVLSVTLKLPAGLALPTDGKPVFTLTKPDSTTATLPAGGSGLVWDASYTVLAGDPAGLGTITATVTDTAHNQSSVVRQFLIDKTPPSISGFSVLPQNIHVGSTVTMSGVANKRLQAATVTTTTGDLGVCTCDGAACATSTSSAPAVSCVITGSHSPSTTPTVATLALVDQLGNASPSSGPDVVLFQGSYTIVPAVVASSLTPGAATITVGTATTLLPVFSGGAGSIAADTGISPGPVTSGVITNVAPGLGTTSYTLNVVSPAGDSNSTNTTVTVVAAPAALIVVDTANISIGASANLTVTFSGGAAALAASHADGSLPTSPTNTQVIAVMPALTTTYTLTVTNAAGTIAQSTVKIFVGQSVTVSMTAPTSPIIPGATAVLQVNVSNNASSAAIDPGGLPVVANGANHNIAVTASTTTIYTLTASNSAGETFTTTATVTVTPPKVTSFAGPTFETTGKTGLTLVASFNASAGATASVNNGCTPASASSSPAIFTCPSLSSDTTYTLTVTLGTGPGNTATAQTKVAVAPDPTNTSLAGPGTINPGAVAAFTGQGCASCTFSFNPSLVLDTGSFTGAFTAHASGPPTSTTLYTMYVTNQAGDSASKTALVTVTQPVIASFVGPSFVTTGTAPSFTAQFLPAGATATVSGGCTGGAVVGTNPAVQTFTGCATIAANTTYTLSLLLGATTVQATALVQVTPDTTMTTLNFVGAAINPGAAANFAGTGCAGCTVTFNPPMTIDTGVALTGAFTAHLTTNPTVSTTVTMSVTNQAGGQSTQTATALVIQPVIASFTAPTIITTGTAPTLNAAFTPATATATITGCTGGTVTGTNPSTQPFTSCAVINGTTTYTLMLQLGSTTVQATAQVLVAPNPTTTTLVFPGAAINPGALASFTGTGCANCTVTFNPPLTTDTGAVTGSFTAHLTASPTITTTVTMSVTNQAGLQTTKTATATVTQPVISSFTGPTIITTGTAPTLNAAFTPSTATATITGCTGGTVTGSNPSTQSFTGCATIAGTTTYTLMLQLGSTTVQATTQVLVASNPATTSLAFPGGAINPGAAANFTGTGCAGCTVTFNPPLTIDTGAVTTGFTAHLTTAPTITTAVTMSVTSQAGVQATQTATATVTQPVISSFTGPTIITTGTAPTLNAAFTPSTATATITGCTGGTVTGTNPATQSFTGCATIAGSTTYTLMLQLGSTTVQATTQVLVASNPATTSLTFPGGAINPGAAANFTGTGCAGCTVTFNPPLTIDTGAFTAAFTAHLTTAPTITTTVTMSVTSQAGVQAAQTATATVTQPVISSFTGPTIITTGTAPTLNAAFTPSTATATITGCTGGTVTGSNPSTQSFTGCATIAGTTTYTLMLQLGSTTVQATTQVLVASNPATTSLTFPGGAINPGAAANFTGAGCAGCTVTFNPPLTLDSGTATTAFTAHLTTAPTVTTTVTMSVTSQTGAQVTKTATATVTQPVIVSFTGPTFVTTGMAPSFATAFTPSTATVTVTGSCTGGSVTGTAPATQPFSGCATITTPTTYTLSVMLGSITLMATALVQIASDPTNASLSFPGATIVPGAAANFTGQGCAGCTVTFNPPLTIDTGAITGPFTAHLTSNPTTTTLVTMSVSNQAGSATTKSATAIVSQPVIASFTGPSFVTSGTAPSFNAQFTPAGATASVSGGCTGGPVTGTAPASQPFTGCTTITVDTLYTLTLTLGTTMVTATTMVLVAPNPTVNLSFTSSPPLLPFGVTTNQVSLTALYCAGSARCSAVFSANGGASTSIVNNTPTVAPQTVSTTYELVVTNSAGATASAQLSVPFYGPQFITPAMQSARIGAAVALLPSGKVLVAGGSTDGTAGTALNTAEIFDPATNSWALTTGGGGATANMSVNHFQASAVAIQNGSVLIIAGNSGGGAMKVVDVYDTANNGFRVGPPILNNRANLSAVAYNSGTNVFIAGGGRVDCEVFTQGTTLINGSWANCGGNNSGPIFQDMSTSRTGSVAALLPGGRYILVAGGAGSDQSGDLYDTNVAITSPGFTRIAGVMKAARTQATATLLANGKVLITGGKDGSATALTSAELFNFNSVTPSSSTTVLSTGSLSTSRFGHAAVLLSGGGVLVAGGTNGVSCGTTASNCNVDVYDPTQEGLATAFGTTFSLGSARTTTFGVPLIIGGRVIFGGGTTTASAADYIVP